MNQKEIKKELKQISIILCDTDSLIMVTRESCLNNNYFDQECVLSIATENLTDVSERLNFLSTDIENYFNKGDI
ncbi:hypothetical protein IJ707_03025 [bacterium]|nr:hypothetical protein [bacterium]